MIIDGLFEWLVDLRTQMYSAMNWERSDETSRNSEILTILQYTSCCSSNIS